MEKLDQVVGRILSYVVAVLLFAIVFTVAFQIAGRHLFAYPPIWTDEYSRLFFCWCSFIGTIVASRDDSHLAIDIFYTRFKPGFQKFINVMNQVFTCLLSGVLTAYSIQQVINDGGSRSLATRTPVYVTTLAMVVGFAGMAVYCAINAVKYIKGIQVQFPEEEVEQ